MRMDKLTTVVQQALSDGQSLAVQKDHNILAPAHIFFLVAARSDGHSVDTIEPNGCKS